MRRMTIASANTTGILFRPKEAVMNLSVLGAAGATGSQVGQQAVPAGHIVTALVRSPQKMAFADDKLRIVQGDATDEAAVAKAMEGADAVISTLGGSPPLISNATRSLLAAVNAQKGAPRIIMHWGAGGARGEQRSGCRTRCRGPTLPHSFWRPRRRARTIGAA
jgi:NAD dependent epimerase/dehydratase family enzyme